MKIEFEIDETQADALAQFIKRIGFEDIRKLCADETETYSAQSALEKIKKELSRNGYCPR